MTDKSVGKGHNRDTIGIWTQMDRDTDGQEEGHRRTERETGTQTNRDKNRTGNEQRQE
jgi:hypothetical protein